MTEATVSPSLDHHFPQPLWAAKCGRWSPGPHPALLFTTNMLFPKLPGWEGVAKPIITRKINIQTGAPGLRVFLFL